MFQLTLLQWSTSLAHLDPVCVPTSLNDGERALRPDGLKIIAVCVTCAGNYILGS